MTHAINSQPDANTVTRNELPGRAWHNPLPGWIMQAINGHLADDPRARGQLQTLQAMADAGDVDAQGNITSIYGGAGMYRRARCSRSTFFRHVAALEARGFVVAMFTGGVNAGRNLASIYAIPATRGGLDHRRVGRRTQQVVSDPETGARQRIIIKPGQQASIWAPPEGSQRTTRAAIPGGADHATRGAQASEASGDNSGGGGGSVMMTRGVVSSRDGGSVMMTPHHPHIHPHDKNHAPPGVGRGGLRSDSDSGRKAHIRRWRLPSLTAADMRDTEAMTILLQEAIAGGAIRSNESDRLWWWCAIEHALRVGQNPGALLRTMLANADKFRLWITEGDESRAIARMKPPRNAHIRNQSSEPTEARDVSKAPTLPPTAPKPVQPPRNQAQPKPAGNAAASEGVLRGDAQRAMIRLTMAAAKFKGDIHHPEAIKAARLGLQQDHGWTDERWQDALAQLNNTNRRDAAEMRK